MNEFYADADMDREALWMTGLWGMLTGVMLVTFVIALVWGDWVHVGASVVLLAFIAFGFRRFWREV